MKIKTIILACLLLASTATQAAIPQGKWTVIQITIEKNTDGNIQTTMYNTPTEVQSHYPRLQELEINARNIVLRYFNGWEEVSPSYTVTGNYLTLTSELYSQPIRYNLNEDILMLFATHSYVYNLPTGQTKQITENWTINLKQQKQ